MSFLDKIVSTILDAVKDVIEDYARRTWDKIIRLLVLVILGITFIAAGSIFLLVGFATYLSLVMYSGLAWAIIGLITVLIGAILLLLLKR